MNNNLFTKLKISSRRLLGRLVYMYVYTSKKIKNTFQTSSQHSSSKKHQKFFIFNNRRWRIMTIILALVFGVYYGLGAAISSKINNQLHIETKINTRKGQNTLSALAYVIKTQVDDQAWTPALPLIFPAAVLDNLPNFQLGVKESANFFIKKLAKRYKDANLKEAGELLDYSPDIWLFSQNKEDKLSPGSAKQYRKALALIENALKAHPVYLEPTTKDFIYLLKSTDTLLSKKISALNRHIQEHFSETLDFRADDLFYSTQGTAYTLHYLISAIAKDYQTEILAVEQYEEITSVLKYLEEATELSPVSVKNAAPNDVYASNHLIYLAYYLSQAQNHLQKIYYKTRLKVAE